MPSFVNCLYYAALFDGEGSLGIYLKGKGRHHYLSVSLANQHKPTIERLVSIWPGFLYEKKDEHIWQWTVTAAKAEKFLRDIFPYSRIKKDQIALALEFRDRMVKGSTGGRFKLSLTGGELAIREDLRIKLQDLKRMY